MAKPTNANLTPNPFITYRDPKTGLWVVVHNTAHVPNETTDNAQSNHCKP